MKSTNYRDAFILASTDCPVTAGTVPSKTGSIAAMQHALLAAKPYSMTSDDLLFEVHAMRQGISTKDRASARAALFAKPQACLRCSPLVKQFGWGLHHDGEGRVALYGIETGAYRELAARADLTLVQGMRSRRP